ncbi:MAG: radical SAM family heme chaperone HemW [Bacteroidales bacterium]|nr:radical SAM family heme chaperone HemW [Bacteroidales bacterium]
MAGVYVHIPFCKSRCIYCDFYSTTMSGNRNLFVERLLAEASERKSFLGNRSIRTVYVGGGTPSQLPASALQKLVAGLAEIFDLSAVEEFTLEVNPEDITPQYAASLPSCINRISMGVQSFVDSELALLQRRHNAQKPAEAIQLLRDVAHIQNISIDLMYGLPNQTLQSFQHSIDEALKLGTQHISAYNLSVEEGTRLSQLVDEGKLTVADEKLCLSMNAMLRRKLHEAGFVQYEISNYALKGFESKHNSSYWNRTPYLGLGPGAHSYDGERLRCWNLSNLRDYLQGNRLSESETLSDDDLFNEQIMLGLRTSHGAILTESPALDRLISQNLLQKVSQSDRYRLTENGLALADEVIRRLMR